MDHEETDPGSVHRAWPARHGGGYPPGWYVHYRYRHRARSASCAAPEWHERAGTVAGRSLRDEHTSTTWVPVRPHDCPSDTPVSLVRASDILDARPPAPRDRART